MKIKQINASVDTKQFPRIYKNMEADLAAFYSNAEMDENKQPIAYTTTNGGIKIYFQKYYTIDLWGWSGLSWWFNELNKRKKDNQKIQLFKNIYLDQKLCLRRIQDGQQISGKSFFDKYQQLEDKNELKIGLFIFNDLASFYQIDEEKDGVFNQEKLFIGLQWNPNLRETLKTLRHQFVHALDYLTSLVVGENIKKLKNYIDINTVVCSQCNGSGKINGEKCTNCNGTGFKMNQHTHVKNKIYSDPRLLTWDENRYTQYQSYFNQIIFEIEDIIRFFSTQDCLWRFHQFGIDTPEILLYFCYLFQYNFKKRTPITKSFIQERLLSLGYENLVQYIKYLSNYNAHKQLAKTIKSLKSASSRTYRHTMNRIYSEFSNNYFKDTQISKQIL